MKLLEGKVALVTGAKGRLGPIWIEALDAAGARTVGVDVEDYDLAVPSQVLELAAHFAHADILVNNAGVDSRPDLGVHDAQVCQVNLIATGMLCHHLGRSMAARGGGVIVNIASLYGLVAPDLRYYNHRPDGWVKDPMYGATKAAIIQLTRDYAARLAPLGVRVNALAPGGVANPSDGLTGTDVEFQQKYTARIPLGRMCQPQDLHGPLVFLASSMSSFITGHVLPLEGGYLCW